MLWRNEDQKSKNELELLKKKDYLDLSAIDFAVNSFNPLCFFILPVVEPLDAILSFNFNVRNDGVRLKEAPPVLTYTVNGGLVS